MQEKRCSSCKEIKPIRDFYKKNHNGTKCKSCFTEYTVNRGRKQKNKAIKYLGGNCIDCKKSYPDPVYVFHHVREKSAKWKKMKLMSWENMKEELDKCVLLCANCHVLRHAEYIVYED